jgi:hypothetical protein
MTQISNNVSRLTPAEAHEAVSIAQEVAQAVGRDPNTPAGKRQAMRLMDDIAAAPADVRSELRAIAAEVKEFAPDYSVAPSLGCHVFQSSGVSEAGTAALEYSVWLLGGKHSESVKADTAAGVVEAAKAAIRKARRMAEFEARYARERAEVEAADKATRDDGEATTGTLPLSGFDGGDAQMGGVA